MKVPFYNVLISLLDNKSTVSDGSDLYERTYKPTPVDHFVTVFHPHAFLVGAFWGVELVDFSTAEETILKVYLSLRGFVPPACKEPPEIFRGGEQTDVLFVFSLYTSRLISIFPERFGVTFQERWPWIRSEC